MDSVVREVAIEAIEGPPGGVPVFRPCGQAVQLQEEERRGAVLRDEGERKAKVGGTFLGDVEETPCRVPQAGPDEPRQRPGALQEERLARRLETVRQGASHERLVREQAPQSRPAVEVVGHAPGRVPTAFQQELQGLQGALLAVLASQDRGRLQAGGHGSGVGVGVHPRVGDGEHGPLGVEGRTLRGLPAGEDADIVAAAVEERPDGVPEPPDHVFDHLLGELPEEGFPGQLEHVEGVAQQPGMVGQQLLVVGFAPVPFRGVAEEPALRVVGAAPAHGVEGPPHVVEAARVAGGLVTPQQELVGVAVGELAVRFVTAVHGVGESPDHRRDCVGRVRPRTGPAALVRGRLRVRSRPRRGCGLPTLAWSRGQVPRRRGRGLPAAHVDPHQHVAEVTRRQVVDAGHVVPVRTQEHDGGPAVAVVTHVDVRPLGVFHSHGHEVGVQERGDLGVGEGGLVHALADAAPEGAQVEHHRFPLVAGALESVRAPIGPVDSMGAVGVGGEAEHGAGRTGLFGLPETLNNRPVRPERSEAKSKDALFHRERRLDPELIRGSYPRTAPGPASTRANSLCPVTPRPGVRPAMRAGTARSRPAAARRRTSGSCRTG